MRNLCGITPHCDWLALKCIKEQTEDKDMIAFLSGKKAVANYVSNLCAYYMDNPDMICESTEMRVDKDGNLHEGGKR